MKTICLEQHLRAQVVEGFMGAKRVASQLDVFKLENQHYPTTEDISTLNKSQWVNINHEISIDPDSGNISVNFTHRRLSSLQLKQFINYLIQWRQQRKTQ